MQKKFLILGHPRSGTGFMSKLMREYGFHIGHERMKSDGISSWMFTVNEEQVYGDQGIKRGDYNFTYLVMNLRHPIDIISSTYYTENNFNEKTFKGKSFTFRKKYMDFTGLNELEIAVQSVLEWYRLIELQRPNLVICIDKNPEDKMYHFLKRHENITLSEPITPINQSINSRQHERVDFQTLKANCREELVEQLINFCHLYGYEL
jgi:hypothetical protein